MYPRTEASKVLTKTEHGPLFWSIGLAGTILVQRKRLFPADTAWLSLLLSSCPNRKASQMHWGSTYFPFSSLCSSRAEVSFVKHFLYLAVAILGLHTIQEPSLQQKQMKWEQTHGSLIQILWSNSMGEKMFIPSINFSEFCLIFLLESW